MLKVILDIIVQFQFNILYLHIADIPGHNDPVSI